MTFKFNFSRNEEDDLEKGGSPTADSDEVTPQWLSADELYPDEKMIREIDEIVKHATMYTCGNIEIGHVLLENALSNILKGCENPDNILAAEKNHSDLITGKYEGGLKIWECTYDLIEYLSKNLNDESWNGKRVLDLGCGAGLLGIMALNNGAEVYFQDYGVEVTIINPCEAGVVQLVVAREKNKEVLSAVTIPNILLNLEESQREMVIKHKCKFFFGDWESYNILANKQSTHKFDIILTSETIYNIQNHIKLVQIFKDRLDISGHIYVAAKSHYFGVGGGMRQFEELLKRDDSFKTDLCWKSESGIKREILKITRKSV